MNISQEDLIKLRKYAEYNNKELVITENSVSLKDKEPTKEQKIFMLKDLLASTDYQAIKYAEGQISAEDYEPIKTQRQAWRDEINELEKLI